ncbi:MAG: hypothetical protein IJ200_12975 [Prevotella sp.]|nr:hypothetical protein [Prevotella sp.]
MKHIFPAILLLVILITAGCEKNITSEGSEAGNTENSAGKTISSDTKNEALTIAEAQQTATGTPICVMGYVIGATRQTINNLCIQAPFEGSTAIVLASQPVTGEGIDLDTDDLFPVCLTDAAKGIRDAYNLEDHPELWNSFVYVYGTRERYMNLPGIKKVQAIETDPNHVPEAQEDTTDDPTEAGGEEGGHDDNGQEGGSDIGNGGDSDPDNGSDDETIGNGNEDEESGKVLSVAEAKQEDSYKTITVEGYIVGAVMGDMQGNAYYSFESPTFDNNKAGIILADKAYDPGTEDGEQFDLAHFSDLLFVALNDCKPTKIKNELNLVSHPENQNKRIRIKGVRKDYLNTKGIKEVTDYRWVTD